MSPGSRKTLVWSLWGFLAVVLFLSGVAFVEQLAPELETQTQDEQALAQFSSALKTDGATLESVPTSVFSPLVPEESSGVPRCQSALRQDRVDAHFPSPSLRLHQRLSIYRI